MFWKPSPIWLHVKRYSRLSPLSTQCILTKKNFWALFPSMKTRESWRLYILREKEKEKANISAQSCSITSIYMYLDARRSTENLTRKYQNNVNLLNGKQTRNRYNSQVTVELRYTGIWLIILQVCQTTNCIQKIHLWLKKYVCFS